MGPLRVEGAHGSLGGDWLEQRAGQLLRVLVCERRRVVPSDEIAEAIWPHAGPNATNTVRHFVHALRERLNPGVSIDPEASPVICRRGGYGLDLERVWVDADELEAQAAEGMEALACGHATRARMHLERAVALYSDDFLTDEPYAVWAMPERERLRSNAADALRALVELGSGSARSASGWLERLAELEPFDEDVHRELISVWLRMGRWSRAARHYESFRARLLREFGALPGFELGELVRPLRQRRCA
ncbi:MAG TPA: BTAD domain-containing putative transcriptional regulator [Thermoleophilaceae bacterium]|nr:BTAD domain-containing putative transcriptional regulator [Thermoleophilaceae bacterium]